MTTAAVASLRAYAAPHLRACRTRSWFGDLVILVFLCTQGLDGVFTYVGMAAVGISEGNPLLGHSMAMLGVGPSLTAAKLMAASCAMLLHVLEFNRVLAVLTLAYIAFAVLPWTWVIFFMGQ